MLERVFSCVCPSALQKLVCLNTEVGERMGGDGEHILRRGRRGKGWGGGEKGGGGGTERNPDADAAVSDEEEKKKGERENNVFFCGQEGGYPVTDCGCKELRQTSRYFWNRF